MKKNILTISLALLSAIAFAQIKIFNGGKTTIGGVNTPYGVSTHFIGDKTTFTLTNPTANPYGAPLIKGYNNFNTNPSYTWWGDESTGIANPNLYQISMKCNNIEKMKLHVGGINVYGSMFFSIDNLLVSSPMIVGHNNNSGSWNPDYTWTDDYRTGIFHPQQNWIGFSNNSRPTMFLTDKNHVFIGDKPWDGGGILLTIAAGENQSNLYCFNENTTNYTWAQTSQVKNEFTKNWVVQYSNNHTFFVLGNGMVYSGYDYFVRSDRRKKRNIDSIPAVLQKIKQIRGVQFQYTPEVLQPGDTNTLISNIAPDTKYGLIAQELETIIPEAVKEMPDGTKAVSYNTVVAVLVEAVKKQQFIIEEMQLKMETCCKTNNGNGHIKGSQRLSTPENNNSQSNELNNPESNANSAFLAQNKPNPFDNTTIIEYFIPDNERNAAITIFDMSGKLLRTFPITQAGMGKLQITSQMFSPGMYYYSLLVNGEEFATKKMILTE